MSILASRYGFARPRAISAMLQRLQAALPSVPIIEAAPVMVPQSTKGQRGARIAAQQVERAQLRADLPFMRHYAANFDDGPSFAEIEALENRLEDLDDYLIFEPETAEFEALQLAA